MIGSRVARPDPGPKTCGDSEPPRCFTWPEQGAGMRKLRRGFCTPCSWTSGRGRRLLRGAAHRQEGTPNPSSPSKEFSADAAPDLSTAALRPPPSRQRLRSARPPDCRLPRSCDPSRQRRPLPAFGDVSPAGSRVPSWLQHQAAWLASRPDGEDARSLGRRPWRRTRTSCRRGTARAWSGGVRLTTEPWLTKAEIAAALKVSVRTVERCHLPAMRVGGQNRYRRSEVERFLRDGPTPAPVVELRPRRTRGTAA